MTPEERFERIEQQTEFIVNQQAQFYTDLRKLEEQTQRNSEHIQRNGEQIQRNSEQVGQVTDLLLRTGRIVEELELRNDERSKRLDERLNILIDVVERYFSNGSR